MSIHRVNKFIATGAFGKSRKVYTSESTNVMGVLATVGISIFQILYLWIGTIPPE
jgi:hypothetical protein